MGHGCFGTYFHRIQRIDDPRCMMCDSGDADTLEHTMYTCVRWSVEREQLMDVIGQLPPIGPDDVGFLKHIVEAMLESSEAWIAVARFVGIVISRKEQEERERERERQELAAAPNPQPARRRGRRRRNRGRDTPTDDEDNVDNDDN